MLRLRRCVAFRRDSGGGVGGPSEGCVVVPVCPVAAIVLRVVAVMVVLCGELIMLIPDLRDRKTREIYLLQLLPVVMMFHRGL